MEEKYHTRPWEEIAAQKRAIRDEAIQKYLPCTWENGQPPWPNKEERAITSIAELGVLQEKIKNRELTAETVIKAYIRRCVLPICNHFRCILTLP
jgi:hypothetical protein